VNYLRLGITIALAVLTLTCAFLFHAWRAEAEVMERTGLTLPEIPERGTLDIRQVMDAPYFFA
jgi:DNA-directed RNA polymerase